MDHHFVWERIDRKIEDGEFRAEGARVQGDEVGLFGTAHYKAPEEFLRSLQATGRPDRNWPRLVPVLLMLATLILAGVYFFRRYRARRGPLEAADWNRQSRSSC